MSDHFVTLVVDDDCGRVVFWHRSVHPDMREAVVLWGKPVGMLFGSHLELWFVNRLGAKMIFPGPDDEPEKSAQRSQWRES